MPKVSVIMPVYNGGSYLKEAIESILNQDFLDYEFIIINDGSTDNSLNLINEIASKDKRIHVISRPNIGYVKTLNEGLEYATSPLIARMDADDIALPKRLGVQVKYMDLNKEVACVGGQYDCIDYKGRFIQHIKVPVHDVDIQKLMLMGDTCICHPLVMMRRDVVMEHGAYDPKLILAEDLDLYLRIGEKWKLGNVPETIFRYRKHINSVSGESHKKQLKNMHEACKKAWRRRGINGEFKNTGWLPTDNTTLYTFLLQCGYSGLEYNDRLMAIEYGMKAIRKQPKVQGGWKLIAKAIIGRKY